MPRDRNLTSATRCASSPTTGAATKLYFFSNIGTQSDLDLYLRKVGIAESWIAKNSPSLFRAVKIRGANWLFGVLALGEGGYLLYQLYAEGPPTNASPLGKPERPTPPLPPHEMQLTGPGLAGPQSELVRSIDAYSPSSRCATTQSLAVRMACLSGK